MQRQIRAATLADAEAIGRIHLASWQAAYRGVLPDALLDGLDLAERIARRRAALAAPAPGSRDWVIVEADDVIGWASTGPARDDDLGPASYELYAIYLAPTQVGTGAGRALMTHALADAGDRGFDEMTMWVLRGNDRALRFYAAAGFAPDPRVAPTPYGETGVQKLRMVRRLP